MLGKLTATIVLGIVGLFVIALPINMIASDGSGPPNPTAGLVVTFILTVAVAFTSPSGRAAWSRLFLTNGLFSLFLPIAAMIFSARAAPGIINTTSYAGGGSYAAENGATIGAFAGGAIATGAAAFIGIILAAIFLSLAFFLRGRAT